MYKILREKVASSVTGVETPEHFVWGKWLRAPTHESITIDAIYSELYDTTTDIKTISPAPLDTFQIQIKQPKSYDKSRKYITPKPKSNKIFFKPVVPSNKSITFNNTEAASVKEINLDIAGKSSVKKFKNKISFNLPKTSEYLKSIKTEVKNIELLKIDNSVQTINVQLAESSHVKVSKIDLSNLEINLNQKNKKEVTVKNISLALPDKPEILKVELTENEKNKVSTYFLKNVKLQKIKVSENYFIPFGFIETIEQPLPYNYFEPKDFTIEEETQSDDKNFIVDEEKIDEEKTFNEEKIFTSNTNVVNYEEVEELLNDEKLINELLGKSKNKPNGKTEEISSLDDNAEDQKENEEQFDTYTGIDITDVNLPDNLYEFQKEGIKTLIQNRFVFLADELGTGKTLQAVTALKVLFDEKIICNPLIVCRNNDIGNVNVSKLTKNPNGWRGNITKILKEKQLIIIEGEKKQRNSLWEKTDSIFITSYNDFLNDLNDNNIPQKASKNIDCIIFDEVQDVMQGKMLVNNFIKNSNTKFVWFLSSRQDEKLKEELETLQKFGTPLHEIKRRKAELADSLPRVIRQDVWFELGEEQKIEYENTLSLGRERITKLVQAGNPFLIQSNIFTLLHQLKQVCNFSSSKKTSPKTDYLLKQIETIAENEQKVLIFSQYDKLGTHRLEELLKERKIKFVSYHQGMSLKEIDTVKRTFRKSKSIHILINGIKTSRSTVNLAEVPYVIYFDQWWNPASVWKTEDYINNPENDKLKIEENLNIYNYFTSDTVEEKIKEVLYRKGLLRKDIIEMLSAETINEIVTIDEWLEILGIQKNENTSLIKCVNKIDKLPEKDLNKKIEYLFARLGYKNTAVEKSKQEGIYDIIAVLIQNNYKIKISGKFLIKKDFDEEEVKEQINKLKSDKNSGKNIIIHLNEISDELILSAGDSFSFIDKNLLANYFNNFHLI